jgi:hypothetical protein
MPSPAVASRPRPVVVVADPLAPERRVARRALTMFAELDEVLIAKVGA